MHIREIHDQNFCTQADSHVELPARGVVLVTGKNGCGKSTLFVESTAVGCWGKTIRGTPPWEEGQDTVVRVVTDTFETTRSRSGRKPITHKWAPLGSEAVAYDTVTKGKDPFAALVGSMDVWRRTSVFSSRSADHFSTASDSVRKKLLENIIGLERFDLGLKACREDLAQANKDLAALTGKAAVLRERMKGLQDRLNDLQETETSEEKVLRPRIPKDRQKAAQVELQDAKQTIDRIRLERSKLMRQIAEAEAEQKQAERALERLNREQCPTCAQPIPARLRSEHMHKSSEADQWAHRVREDNQVADKRLAKELREAEAEVERLRKYLDKAAEIEREWAAVEANNEKRKDKREVLETELTVVKAKLEDMDAKVAVMQAERDQLEAAELVLGLKGPRVHLLRDALAGMTVFANGWLARLFPGVTVTLQEERDEVTMEMLGLRHGHGYAACSDGQQRRIDIANLLALSTLESASRGVTPGTLLLDEVADALDDDGIQCFAEVIAEIAEERCVVLITHNPALYQGIRAVKRFYVSDGTVSEH